jgi:hypothetical protein
MYAHEQKARSARSSTSSIDTPRVSTEQRRESSHQRSSSSLKHAAQKVIQAAKEHHRAVNSAFDAYYGTSYYSRNTGATGSVRYSA